jgi:hypothetical protein
MAYLKILIIVMFLAVIFQMYNYATSRQREEKQKICRGLGILLFTVGVVSLVTRDHFFVLAGLFLMMIGFRLMAQGLDRLDKKIYIDSYKQPPSE